MKTRFIKKKNNNNNHLVAAKSRSVIFFWVLFITCCFLQQVESWQEVVARPWQQQLICSVALVYLDGNYQKSKIHNPNELLFAFIEYGVGGAITVFSSWHPWTEGPVTWALLWGELYPILMINEAPSRVVARRAASVLSHSALKH